MGVARLDPRAASVREIVASGVAPSEAGDTRHACFFGPITVGGAALTRPGFRP